MWDLFNIKNWQQNVAQGEGFKQEFLINAEALLKGSGANQGGKR